MAFMRRNICYEATNHSLITLDELKNIKKAIKQVQTEVKEITTQDQAIINLFNDVIAESDTIQSCDLPTDKKAIASEVLRIQRMADWILGKANDDNFAVKNFDRDNASTLEKIFKIAALSMRFNAGNCQEKAFFGFYSLLKKLVMSKLSSGDATISLELGYFNNHFIILVDNRRFMLDPWLSAFCYLPKGVETLTKIFPKWGDYRSYFVLDSGWNCFVEPANNSAGLVFDSNSTNYTFPLYVELSEAKAEAKAETKAEDAGYGPTEKKPDKKSSRHSPY